MDPVDEQTPFTFAGQCDDEVTFTFDNTDKQLFVSRNFLSMPSPVFRTMFTSDFIEKSTGVVEMKDKEYDNVLEFLLILHPGMKKPITEKNVYEVLSIAEQYQIDILVTESKVVMRRILTEKISFLENDKGYAPELRKTVAAYACIMVLSTAVIYSYQDIIATTLETISKFGSKVFLKENLPVTGGHVYNEKEWKINAFENRIESRSNRCHSLKNAFTSIFGDTSCTHDMEEIVLKRKPCTDAFNELPEDIKSKYMQNRLDKLEDDKIR